MTGPLSRQASGERYRQKNKTILSIQRSLNYYKKKIIRLEAELVKEEEKKEKMISMKSMKKKRCLK